MPIDIPQDGPPISPEILLSLLQRKLGEYARDTRLVATGGMSAPIEKPKSETNIMDFIPSFRNGGPSMQQDIGPGTFLNPSMSPLFMQSGMMQAPPQGRTAPSDLDMSDPFARAAYRQQQSVQPDFGRAGEGPSIARVVAAAMPGGMFTRAATAAPKTMAAVLGLTGLATGATEAGEQPFKWDDPNTARSKRLAEIDKEMKDLATKKTPSAPGTQAKRIDALQGEQNKLLEERGTEYNNAFAQFQKQQELATQAAAEKKRQETSFFDMVPGTRSAISAAMPFVSYFGGKYMGKRLGTLPAMGAGAVGGGLEGALSQYVPTEVDMGLPRSAPARQAAAQDLQDPAYWGRLAAMAGGNAGLGAFGAFRGAMGRRMPLPMIPPPSSGPMPGPAAPPPMGFQGPIPGGGGGVLGPSAAPMISQPAMPSLPPPAAVFSKKSGRWHDPSTGNFVRTPANPPPLMGE